MINVRSEREVSCKRLIQQRNYCKTSSTTLHATIEAKTCDRLRHKSSEPSVIEMKCLSQKRNMCSCEADNRILLRRFYPSLNDATATLGCQLRHETRRALAGRPAIAKIAKLVGNQLSRAATCNCYCCFSLFSLSLSVSLDNHHRAPIELDGKIDYAKRRSLMNVQAKWNRFTLTHFTGSASAFEEI